MINHIKNFNTRQEQIDFCFNNDNLELPIATINSETNQIILNKDLNLKYYCGIVVPKNLDNANSINYTDLDEIRIYNTSEDGNRHNWYILIPDIYNYDIYDDSKTILLNDLVNIDYTCFHMYRLYTLPEDYSISVVFVKK